MKKIIALSFPANSKNLGLEPSILNVLPQTENVEFYTENRKFDDSEVEQYLCSIYISGFDEFKKWAMQHDTRKIIVGGYHPTMFPDEFLNFAEKIIIGPCDDLNASLSQKGVVFERSYYDRETLNNARFVCGKILRTLRPKKGWIRIHGEVIDNSPEKPSGKSDLIIDRIIPGVLTFKNTPRYDLYSVLNNQQIIPDKNEDDLCTSINTSFGCPMKCDFCCTPVMFGPCLISKPLKLVEREINMIKKRLDDADSGHKKRFIFIRDENFTLQRDYSKKLAIIKKANAKIYLFASANTLTEEVVKTLKENNVYMVCLGLEDPTKDYNKNKTLDLAVKRLKDNRIFTYISFIVDPLKVSGDGFLDGKKITGAEKGKMFYELLEKRFHELKPEMVCGNFLMPFPGTALWDQFYHLVSKSDFKYYDSKTPFLVKNELVFDKMRYFMFEVQWKYYNSQIYNNEVRKFDCGDTLNMRFLELKEEFEKMFKGIKHARP